MCRSIAKHSEQDGKSFFSPVNAGDIDDDIDHITAQFVGLHVHRGAVGGDVYFTNDVKQEGFLDPRMLQDTTGVERQQNKHNTTQ